MCRFSCIIASSIVNGGVSFVFYQRLLNGGSVSCSICSYAVNGGPASCVSAQTLAICKRRAGFLHYCEISLNGGSISLTYILHRVETVVWVPALMLKFSLAVMVGRFAALQILLQKH